MSQYLDPGGFERFRRLRRTPGLRALVRETDLRPEQMMYPLFVRTGEGVREPIGAMPGQCRLSVDTLVEEVQSAAAAGVASVLLFGLPKHKDPEASDSASEDGIVQQAIRAIKAAVPAMVVATDVCVCAYTDHGHCGILGPDGVDNDSSLDLLSAMAVSHARAGADIVAPSAMMDGQVAAIRAGLDDAGLTGTAIMGYSAKYASAYYGPFREAANSAPGKGDRRGYQMDPPNAREALREAQADEMEGADILMVKPGLAYLDILQRIRQETSLPLAVYNVSGEYSMIKAAAANGWIDEKLVTLETMTAFRRAGADIIITYHAKDVATWLRDP